MELCTLRTCEDKNFSLMSCCLLREYYLHVVMFCGLSFVIKGAGLLGCDTVLLALFLNDLNECGAFVLMGGGVKEECHMHEKGGDILVSWSGR
jgi:hypothetical protein